MVAHTLDDTPRAAHLDAGAAEAARRMDAMYRHQRHIYDLTRKFYLFGRDQLLDILPINAGTSVLEMGCGTGRNLKRLGASRPGAQLYGIDISAEMLATARRKAAAPALAQAGCHGFDPVATFGRARFDVIYFSYVLSMIPDWQGAFERAWELLAPGGTLGVVDFADQSAAPAWRRHLLLAWLRLFNVHPRTEIQEAIAKRDGVVHVEDVKGGYGYIVLLRKPA